MEEKQQTAACMIRKGMAEQLIFAGVVGMVLALFLWPFFLMIIFQVLILMAPILVIRLIIQRVRKEKIMIGAVNPGAKAAYSFSGI